MRFPFDLDDPVTQAVFVVMALMCFIAFWRYLYLIIRSRRWRLITAEVSRFDHATGSVNDMKSDRVKVRYQYVVDGKKYEGDKLGIREWMFPGVPGADFRARPAMIKKVKNRVRSNKEISVYYDPDKPTLSCIDPSPEISLLLFFLVCMILLLGLAFL